MHRDPQRAYKAMLARDRRFDGLFFVGVTTTGVYCRPICPARTPGFSRCTFHPTAAHAESAGFRACFRCRPELAPGHASVDQVSRLAAEAAQRIEGGALDHQGSLEALACELGVTSRHLRRVLEREVGVAPLALAETHRLATAKRLLTDSGLSMSAIAFASGFGSIRRFNDAFKKRFGGPPRRLGRTKNAMLDRGLRLRLSYRPPLDWKGMLEYLAPRAIEGIEEIRGETWRRLVVVNDVAGILEVENVEAQSVLVAHIPAELATSTRLLALRVRALFDLDAQPLLIAAALSPSLPLVKRQPGLRVPGAFDGFELAVRAILGQQVSVKGASTLAARLARRFGRAHPLRDDPLCRTFPSPEDLAGHTPAEIATVGLPKARAEAIHNLAVQVRAGVIDLRGPLSHPGALAEAITTLQAQPGIGPWTAAYIAMRALRWPDAFVAGDLGVRKALADGGAPLTERDARTRGEAFRPYRAYAVLHLWQSLQPQSAHPPVSNPARTR